MAPKPLDIKASFQYDNKGAGAAIKDVQALAKALADAAKGGAPLAAAQAKAAIEAQKLAQAEQRTAAEAAKAGQQQAKLAAEVSKVAAADSRATQAAATAAAATDRAAMAALRRAQAEQKAAEAAAKSASGAQSWTSSLQGAAQGVDGLIGKITSLGSAFAVVAAAKGAFDFAREGASVDAAAKSFDNLTKSAGTSGDVVLGALRKAADGTVSDAEAISAANRALLLMGSQSAEKLPQLMEIAKASATALGDTTAHVFDSLVTGISRGSALLIDNAGITFKAEEAYAAYAASVGKSADNLSSAEKQQAFLNATLAAGQTIIAQSSGGAESSAVAFQKLEAASTNLKNSLAGLLASGLAPLANSLAGVFQGATDGVAQLQGAGAQMDTFEARLLDGATTYEEYQARIKQAQADTQAAMDAAFADDPLGGLVASIAGVMPQVEGLSAAQFELAQAIQEGGASASEAAAAVSGLSDAQIAYAEGLMAQGAAAGEAAAQATEYGAAINAVNEVQGQLYDDTSISTSALEQLSVTMSSLVGSSDANRAAVADLASQYLSGAIDADTLMASVMALETATLNSAQADVAGYAAASEHAVATRDAAAATEEARTATLDKYAAEQVAQAETELLAIAQQQLMDAARQAASGQQTAEAAAATLAAQFNISTAEAYKLISALRELAGASGAKAAPVSAAFTARTYGGGAPGDVARAAQASRESQEALRAAQVAELTRQQGGRFGSATPGSRPGGGGRAGGGGGGGGGAGKAKANEAQKAADQLAEIERKTGDRLAQIDQQTAEKLVEIDRKAAAERARIAQDLANEIATSTSRMVADQEANDLDLVGVTDKNEKKKLAAREKAEADARRRQQELNAETMALIESGEVDKAEAERAVKEEANAKRQALDEDYYARQAELAKNPAALAELQKQYEEAVKAQDEATAEELKIAQAKAEAKKKQAEDEKAAVVAQAQEQKDGVVAAAVEQAEKVKGASADQKAQVVNDLQAQGSAATDWAGAIEAAASRVAAAASRAKQAISSIPSPSGGGGESAGGGGGATAAAGGGTFVTSGPASFVAGDNPGGVELVTVTPLSGRGSTRVGSGVSHFAGGGSILTGIQGAAASGDVGSLNLNAIKDYADKVKAVVDILEGLSDITKAAASASGGGISVSGLQAMTADAQQALAIISGSLVPIGKKEADQLSAYADAIDDAVGVLQAILDLTAGLAETGPPPPYLAETVRALAGEALVVINALQQTLVPVSAQIVVGLQSYQQATEAAIAILSVTLDLRDAMVDIAGTRQYFYETIQGLAGEARVAVDLIRSTLVPLTEAAAAELTRYQEAASAAMEIVTQTLELRKAMQDLVGVRQYFYEIVYGLVSESRVVADLVRRVLVPLSERSAEDLQRYQESVGAAIQILTDVLSLREALSGDLKPPIAASLVRALAAEARLALTIVEGQLIPITQDEADALGRYADAVSSAVGVISDVAGLRGNLADLAPPISAAQVSRLAADAQRVAQIVMGQLVPVTEDQAGALGRYRDAVGSATGALTDVLGVNSNLFADYVSPSDRQIGMVVRDAKRLTDAFTRAAATMSTEGSEQARAYADATSSAVGAARESLLTMQAINDQTFAVDPKKLRQFEQSSLALYGVLGHIGQRAAALPTGSIAAATSAAGALKAQSEALMSLASVPFDNLPGLAAALGGGGGGGGGLVVNLTFAPGAIVAGPNIDTQQLINQIAPAVARKIGGTVNMNR